MAAKYLGKLCACCKQEESIVGRDLAVDHCHSTGRIRGLLCQACNTAIGKLGDKLDGIEKARFYLLKTLPYAGYSI